MSSSSLPSPATDTAVPATDRPRARVALAIGSLGFFLITLDISIVNVALTNISQDLGGGTAGQQWTIDGYTLLFASLLLFAGNLTDRIGAKQALTLGITVFTLASAACAGAPGIGALVAARCVQGAGAAIMLPASMALIREAFPDSRRRARALGVWAVGGAVAALIGQPLGGVLTTLDWRWVFTINLPVCAAMLICLVRVAHSPSRPSPFDWPGQLLALIAMAGLVYGLIDGGHAGFASASAVLTLAVAALATVGFLVVQARVSHPMMPLDLFTAQGFRIASVIGFCFMVGNYGSVFLSSLFLQQHLGLSPLRAGLVYIPSAVLAIVANLSSGPVTNRFGARVPVVSGMVSMVVGLVALAALVPLESPLLVAFSLIFVGAGGALAMPAVTGVVLDGVAPEQAGAASAVFNTFRQIGGAVAIAIFGALIAGSGGFVTGMQIGLATAAALLLLAALIGLRVRTK